MGFAVELNGQNCLTNVIHTVFAGAKFYFVTPRMLRYYIHFDLRQCTTTWDLDAAYDNSFIYGHHRKHILRIALHI